jgi:hypothetical protein
MLRRIKWLSFGELQAELEVSHEFSQGVAPHAPGNPEGYQNKWLA